MCCEIMSQEARREAYKKFYVEHYLSSSTTIFPALDTDYDDIIISEDKTLLEICMDRILCDVYILSRIVKRIPKVLLFKLIDRALETDRILSVKLLLTRYPNEEFVFPLPDYLRNCAVVQSQNLETPIFNYIRNMKDKLSTVISAFESVVLEKDTKSSWRVLNLNQLPNVNSLLKSLCKFFADHSYDKQYVVKGSFMFIEEQDYKNFIKSKDMLSPNLNLILTGIYALRIPVCQQLIDVFDRVNDEDLKYLAVDFVMTNLSQYIPSMQRFKNLTSLFLTYIKEPKGNDLDDLAQVIYELPELRNLAIRSSDIPNRLQTLLMKNCKMADITQSKKLKTEGDPSCCVVHRGKLRYLDVSYCRLGNVDLECLKEYPFCANLKHLSLGSNERIHIQKLADCLEYMAPNLVILDLYGTFSNSLDMQPFIDILGKFKMLKFLVLGIVCFQDNQFHSFCKALFNIERLKEIQMRSNEIRNEDLVELAQSLLCKKGVHLHLK